MMTEQPITLPYFVFFDGNTPNGNLLEGRIVAIHTKTATIFEIFHKKIVFCSDVEVREFIYINPLGIKEKFTCAVYYSGITDKKQFNTVLDEAIEWYTTYLKWKDKNILVDAQINNYTHTSKDVLN